MLIKNRFLVVSKRIGNFELEKEGRRSGGEIAARNGSGTINSKKKQKKCFFQRSQPQLENGYGHASGSNVNGEVGILCQF